MFDFGTALNLKRTIATILNFASREQMLDMATKFIFHNEISGVYLEFGTGPSIKNAHYYAQRNHLQNIKFYVFDSFEGLPEPKDKSMSKFKKGNFKTELEKFRHSIRKLKNVETIEGWYSSTLNAKTKKTRGISKASIVHIDCDIYESTVKVLDFITDLLQQGTVLIFDDWFCYKGNPSKGEQRAVNEWLKKHPEITLMDFYTFGWNVKSFIVCLRSG